MIVFIVSFIIVSIVYILFLTVAEVIKSVVRKVQHAYKYRNFS